MTDSEREKKLFSNLSEKDWIDNLQRASGLSSSDTYCIGLHLRHVFDLNAPDVRVRAVACGNDANEKASKIQQANQEAGRVPLNQVLDYLHHWNSGEDPEGPPKTDPIRVVVLQIAFGMTEELSHHEFDMWEAKSVGPWSSLFTDQPYAVPEALGERIFFGRFGVREWGRGDEDNISNFICGAEKLCQGVRIPSSQSVYKAIVSAVLSLELYKSTFGPHVTTVLVRPHDPFSLATGVTIISKGPLPFTEVRGVVDSLNSTLSG